MLSKSLIDNSRDIADEDTVAPRKSGQYVSNRRRSIGNYFALRVRSRDISAPNSCHDNILQALTKFLSTYFRPTNLSHVCFLLFRTVRVLPGSRNHDSPKRVLVATRSEFTVISVQTDGVFIYFIFFIEPLSTRVCHQAFSVNSVWKRVLKTYGSTVHLDDQLINSSTSIGPEQQQPHP